MRNRLLKALDGVPIQFSLVVKIDPESFSEEDILPLTSFVNEKVEEVEQEELPVELTFGGARIVLRRYTVDVSPTPRIVVVTRQ
ncbi:MAG: hypothetical protein ACE5QW_05280 [Thermoplasmata archaeon]